MKTTKERLEELQDLLQAGHISESEFRIARLHILKEGGVDVINDISISRRRNEDVDLVREEEEEEEEEPRRGCGCGCFLTTLVLIAAITAGVFFAAPKWPDSYGGEYARAARRWMEFVYKDFVSYFSDKNAVPTGDPAKPSLPTPPVSSGEEGNLEVSSNDVPEKGAPEGTLAEPSSAVPGIDVPSWNSNALVAEIPFSGPASALAGPAAERWGVISLRESNRARIRSAPGPTASDNVVGWSRNGDRVLIAEEETVNGALWYNIRYEEGNRQGWISGALVKLE